MNLYMFIKHQKSLHKSLNTTMAIKPSIRKPLISIRSIIYSSTIEGWRIFNNANSGVAWIERNQEDA